MNKNKNGFIDYKNISGKDSNYKGKKGNNKKDNKNNNKRNRISKKENTYLIITLIFFNLIISNNNIIENNFSDITLKVKGPGFSYILHPNFFNNHKPDIVYINGNQNSTITNIYYFN